MKEIWKTWKDTRHSYKGGKGYLWEVSNFGRIKKNGKIMPCDDERQKYAGELVYRIVAKLFIPNPENKPCVDHIDCNAFNNRADNLRWATYKENNNNPITKQRHDKAMKEVHKRKEVLLKQSNTMKTLYEDKEQRALISERLKRYYSENEPWNKGLTKEQQKIYKTLNSLQERNDFKQKCRLNTI